MYVNDLLTSPLFAQLQIYFSLQAPTLDQRRNDFAQCQLLHTFRLPEIRHFARRVLEAIK